MTPTRYRVARIQEDDHHYLVCSLLCIYVSLFQRNLQRTTLRGLPRFREHVSARALVGQGFSPVAVLPLYMLYGSRDDPLSAAAALAQKGWQVTWLQDHSISNHAEGDLFGVARHQQGSFASLQNIAIGFK